MSLAGEGQLGSILRRTWRVAAACLALGWSAGAQASAVTLDQSYAGNINYVVTGGTLRAEDNNNDFCALNASSTAALSGIPGGSTITAAYLYWAGSGATADNTVTFAASTRTADRTFSETYVSGSTHNMFGAVDDVTSLVTGNGNYTFSGLTVDTGAPYSGTATCLAGWALVVIYTNASEDFRVINIFDGLQQFRFSSITLTPSNFQVPVSPINGKFSLVTWEGDPDINGAGEYVEFNNNELTDAANPDSQQFNSTINTIDNNTDKYGVDIDTYDVSAYLAAGNTSATTEYSADGDRVLLMVEVISVTNVPVADLAISKSHSGDFTYAVNGTYAINVTNNGPSNHTGTITVTDTLPAGLSYVSATGTNWSCSHLSGTVTCTYTNTLANGATTPDITLTVAVGPTAIPGVSNTASVAGALFDNQAGNDSDTDATTVRGPDFSTSTKTVVDLDGGQVEVGDTLRYTITLNNTGQIAGTTAVTDDIPALVNGFAVVSVPGGATDASTGAGTGANGTGFLDVTGISVANGGSAAVVFDVVVDGAAQAGDSIDNTATVTPTAGPGATPGAPTMTLPVPNFSTSTKTVVDLSGGDVLVGDTLRYTITLNNTGLGAGVAAVTDDMSPYITGFTVLSTPAGSTDSSTGSGTGANGTGLLNVTGITVAAGGSAAIVFDVIVDGSAQPGDDIDNTATITPNAGTGGTPSAPTLTVNPSGGAGSGNKQLYVHNTGNALTRVVQNSTEADVTIEGNGTAGGTAAVFWTMAPTAQLPSTITASPTVTFYMYRGSNAANNTVRVRLYRSGSPGTYFQGTFNRSTVITSQVAATPSTVNLTLNGGTATAPLTLPVGESWVLRITNEQGSTNANRRIFMRATATFTSQVVFATSTVINVDSVVARDAAYNGGVTPAWFEPGETVYLRAVVSDPFGSADITGATVDITNPGSTLVVNDGAMTQVNDSGAATKTYEYAYVVPASGPGGYWTFTVTASEGSEGTVTHSNTGTFRVVLEPDLLSVKSSSVLSDPVNGGTNPKRIPGAVVRYSVTLTNSGIGSPDADSVVVTDVVPANTRLCVSTTCTGGADPVEFVDGTPTSALSYTYASHVAYSSQVGGGAPYTYTPTPDGNGYDSNVTGFRVTPSGTMAASSGTPPHPSFTLRFRIQVR